MGLAVERDTDEVVAAFAAWRRARGESPDVAGCERASAGFSSETFVIDVGRADLGSERVVLKVAPAGPAIFPRYDMAQQAGLHALVAAAGVPAPVPATAETDTRWLGAPFLVMPFVAGHIVDEMPTRDHWLTRADPVLATTAHGAYLDTLADIHRIDWRGAGAAELVATRDDLAELAHWRAYLEWYGDGEVLVPALVDALDWCADHRPGREPDPALLWGDVRLGNVVFDETRTPVAVLDWEMASIGAPEHDLAWALSLEAVQGQLLGRSVPGFLDHEAAVARYESRLGREVVDLGWYEVLALVRSTAIMTRVLHLRALAGEPGFFALDENPILGIIERRIDAAS